MKKPWKQIEIEMISASTVQPKTDKEEIMVTLKNKAGRRMRVPVQYAQKAANSGAEEFTESIDVEFGNKLMDEYVERLKKRTEKL